MERLRALAASAADRAEEACEEVAQELETLSEVVGRIGRAQADAIVEAALLTVELEAARDQLAEARDRAEEASRIKSQFLASMSHELRTPLHGILSFAELGTTRANAMDAGQLIRYFDRIRHSGELLLDLVNNLLDLSRLESGHMQYRVSPCLVADLLTALEEEFEAQLESRGVGLDTECPGGLTISADRQKALQVLRNLVGNALKFAPQGTAIHIVASEEEESALIQVLDRGPGVPDGDLERVFERFVQSEQGSAESQGTGLGLAISREIVQGHGGALWAERREGGGAAFKIHLPLAAHRVGAD